MLLVLFLNAVFRGSKVVLKVASRMKFQVEDCGCMLEEEDFLLVFFRKVQVHYSRVLKSAMIL